MTQYDCTQEILNHINKVRKLLQRFRSALYLRGLIHDASKLKSPEKEVYDVIAPRLGALEFGSQDYKDALAEFAPAIKHHHENNPHHPEYHERGIDGMSLVDIVEMLADWRVASSQTKNGNIMASIEICAEKYKISPQLKSILINTVRELKWNDENDELF